jgi:hypothetical protein
MKGYAGLRPWRGFFEAALATVGGGGADADMDGYSFRTYGSHTHVRHAREICVICAKMFDTIGRYGYASGEG